jgi:26S proteasome regulatory subunit N7
MGSEPQFAKNPNLRVAQSIFTLSTGPAPAQQSALTYLQNAIKEQKMAPLYRHLAHPTEGVLNSTGESGSSDLAKTLSHTQQPGGSITRRGSLVSSNLVPVNKQGLRAAASQGLLAWDESLYEQLKKDNEKELEEIQKEEDEAEEKAGETEVQAARSKRADFWARVGDKVCFRSYSRQPCTDYAATIGQGYFLV